VADISNKPSQYDDTNVKANVQAVIADPKMDHLGDWGDDGHQAGAGDHTPRSTHRGKFGYPTQGKIHAHDFKMSQADQNLLEAWVRAQWRNGNLKGLKYMNVNNRHWNIQTNANWLKALNGTLKATYSGDHHVHFSYENGNVDQDLIKRFIAYRDKKSAPTTPQVQPISVKETEVYKVVKLAGADKPATYLGNYITRRWIQTESELTKFLKMAGQAKPIEVTSVKQLNEYGQQVGPEPSPTSGN